jgi:serine/threonine protein kinase
MKCVQCGFENPSGLAYCGRCGTRLTAVESPPASSTQTLELPREAVRQGRLLANRFEVLEEIGSGGMGTVYRVFDRQVNEEMALKVLNPEIASNASTVERFKNELKLARRIGQKNVCRVFDLHEEAGMFFITMEYIPGEDLKTLIGREGRLSAERAVALAKPIAEGLAEAHRLGVIHRDLKPQNIMIDREGNPKIMDFGIARRLSGSSLTVAETLIGTPHYMSPEQAAGESVDQRSDLYALGAILYEMVTGRPPFEGENSLVVALKHKTEAPRHPRELNAEVPAALDRLILKCLAKKKDERYQSAADLIAGLDRYEDDSDPAAAVAPEKGTATLSLGERICIASIAVLPFKDMSPQRDQGHLCEGLAEELINALAQVKGLKVAARTSAFSFKGKDEDIREIGRQLNVGSILEGSIQKSGSRLRVTTQLICVADGYHLWSERFDRNIKDVFAVQDEIAMAVVEKLKVELLEGEKERVKKRHTQDEKAYELYLKGRYLWNRRTPKGMVLAVDFFQRAIDRDPRFALPYVGIADVFNMLAEFGFVQPREAYLKSRSLLQKAQEIDDSSSELYASLALITYAYEWDLPAAERYARRSIELNPLNSWAHMWSAEIAGTRGRMKEALEEAGKGIEIDPFSSMSHALYGIILSAMGPEAESRAYMLKTLAMEPDNPMFHLWLGEGYLAKPAMPEKAVEHLQKALDLGVTNAYGYLGMAQALAGRKEEAWMCLRKLERIEKEPFVPLLLRFLFFLKPGLKHFRIFKKKYVPPYLKALIYCGLNMTEDALAQMEKSGRERDYLLPVVLKLLSLYDLPSEGKITASPRFQALLAKIKYN